ncbi:MAG: hypothetical protein KTR21_04365 [Rhodobacteraceae bacterium]|nr:hypothetical protein [Paracoccaceae bacterium]
MIRVLAMVAACAVCGSAYGQASSEESPEPETPSNATPAEAPADEGEAEDAESSGAVSSGGAATIRSMGGADAAPQIFHSQYFPEDTLIGECRLLQDLCVQRAADTFCQEKGFTQSMGYNMERRTRSVGVSWHAQFITCVLFMRPRVPDPRLQPETAEEAAEETTEETGASQ